MKKARVFVRENKFFVIVALALVVGAFYFGFRGNDTSDETAIKTETAMVQSGNISVSVSGSGQVFADSRVDIRPQVAGDGLDVVQVAVQNDQEVKKEDLIAVLDSKDAQKDIRDTQLSLRLSEIKMKQTEDQYDTRTVEDKWMKQLQELTVQQNINQLVDSREDLQEYSIRAPFDGIVTNLSVEVGDSVARDEVLASVITWEMFAEISLNEVDAVKVKQGNSVELTFDALSGVTTIGTVTKIDTIGTVEQGVVYFKAEVAINEPHELLRSGMSVSAGILTESKDNILFIPVSALQTGSDRDYVNVVPSSVSGDISSENVVATSVETGISDGVVVEIIKGLKRGDQVVTKMGNSTAEKTSPEGTSGLLDSAVKVPGSGMRR